MNKDNVKEILKILIEIQAYQCVFFRNVFRSNLKKLDRNEMNYLLILSDSLHNFPSFIESCLMFLEGKETSMQNWNFFETEVQRLKITISDAENCNIKFNNTIRGWMFDLTRMNQYVDLLQKKLKLEGIE